MKVKTGVKAGAGGGPHKDDDHKGPHSDDCLTC